MRCNVESYCNFCLDLLILVLLLPGTCGPSFVRMALIKLCSFTVSQVFSTENPESAFSSLAMSSGRSSDDNDVAPAQIEFLVCSGPSYRGVQKN